MIGFWFPVLNCQPFNCKRFYLLHVWLSVTFRFWWVVEGERCWRQFLTYLARSAIFWSKLLSSLGLHYGFLSWCCKTIHYQVDEDVSLDDFRDHVSGRSLLYTLKKLADITDPWGRSIVLASPTTRSVSNVNIVTICLITMGCELWYPYIHKTDFSPAILSCDFVRKLLHERIMSLL